MEACNITIGSLADLLPNRDIETIINALMKNNIKIYRGSKAEKKIQKYYEIFEKIDEDLDQEDAILII